MGSFDPYYTWLGIRPEEQPPHHYRLLGLQLFEDNLDAIEHAADRQMAHLRTLQTGKHAELSQRLLNEVASAKVCLLNAQKKAAYDATLREQSADPLAPMPVAVPLAEPLTTPFDPIKADRPGAPMLRRVGHKSHPPTLYLVIAAAAVGIVILGLLLLWPRGADQPPSLTGTTRTPSPPLQPPVRSKPKADPASMAVKPIVAPPPPQAPSTSKAEPSTAQTLPLNEWIELLPQVDVKRDAVLGRWERKGEAVGVTTLPQNLENGRLRLMLPVIVQGSYELEYEFTRDAQSALTTVILPVGSQGCDLLLGFSEEKNGLEVVDGCSLHDSPAARTRRLEEGRHHRARVNVDLQNENAAIRVVLDDEPLLEWAGKQQTLAHHANWSLPDANRLGVGGTNTSFHRVRFRCSAGTARWAVPASPPAVVEATPVPLPGSKSLPIGQWVDVLPYADLEWGRVEGDWSRQPEGIVSGVSMQNNVNPRFALPIEIDGNYDLEVELTRNQRDLTAGVILPVGRKRVVLRCDLRKFGTPISGLEPVDGKPAMNGPTSREGAAFTTGQRAKLAIQVRLEGDRASIHTSIDGKPFLQWAGPQESLSLPSRFWSLPGENPLGLTSNFCQVTFHTVRLRLISGKAVVAKLASESLPAASPKPAEPSPLPPVAKNETRLPLPSAAEQEKTTARINEVHQLKQNRSGTQQITLAKELLSLSKRAETTPVERLVLLRTAVDLAREGGDVALMLQAIDRIAAQFEVDGVSVRAKGLVQFAKDAHEGSSLKGLVEAADRTIAQALADDRYDLAMDLAEEVYRLGQKSQGKAFRKQTYDRRNEVKKLYERWQETQQSLAAVKAKPEDPEVNLAAGRWYCFEKGDWRQGLPHLAKGKDDALKSLAQQELASPPRQPADQIKLADAWLAMAQAMDGRPKEESSLHAGAWYRQAELSGVSGLLATKVAKELKEIARLGRPIPELPGGEPLPGEELPLGVWVNVLKWADVDWGLVRGDWQRNGEELVANYAKWAPGGHSRMAIPVAIEGSYDLQVEFTRTKAPFMVGTILPVELRQVTMVFDQGPENDKAAGLEFLGGKWIRDNPSGKRGPLFLQDGQRNVVLHQVRLEEDQVRIEVFLNGQPFLQWSGKQELLTASGEYALPATRSPGLVASGCWATFHAARLRLASGKAVRVDVARKPSQ